ncbi:unnamed protein product [Cylicocyclus nassatus]|uniref:SCP domain-containing protein n=1 Tax=Cylicocyclus nassatus TaxID=53992 RepID=A0AA36M6F6_CYLNA|nr:unnamed protein product [Cylicocyclus nassatus]
MLCTFIVVAATFPAVVRGAQECDGGSMESSDVNEILNRINEMRSSVIQGNQKNGQGQEKLPAGKYMTQINWSCDLEKEAMGGTNADCSDPTAPSGKSGFYKKDSEDTFISASYYVENWLRRIEDFPLTDYKDGAVKYSGAISTKEFANLINPEATEIGCAFGSCSDSGDSMFTVYCLTNKDPLACSYDRGKCVKMQGQKKAFSFRAVLHQNKNFTNSFCYR